MSQEYKIQVFAKRYLDGKISENTMKDRIFDEFNLKVSKLDASVPGMLALNVAFHQATNNAWIPTHPALSVEEINFDDKTVKLVIRFQAH